MIWVDTCRYDRNGARNGKELRMFRSRSGVPKKGVVADVVCPAGGIVAKGLKMAGIFCAFAPRLRPHGPPRFDRIDRSRP